MSKKNTLPIKWILGILVILMAVAYWTTQQTQNKGQGILPVVSNISSQNNFFQFLASMMGLGNQPSNQNTAGFEKTGNFTTNQQNLNLITTSTAPAPQGTNAVQEENNAGNNTGNNSGINPANNSGNNPGTNSESNTNQETGNLTPSNNPGSNANQETGNLLEANAENNPEAPSEINAESNTGQETGNLSNAH